MRIASIASVAAVAALAAPAAASAADIQTGVHAVKSHTTKANKALSKAEKLFKGGDLTRGTLEFTVSRKQMGLAKAAAAKLIDQAQTPTDKALAAQAEVLVADQDHVDIVKLASLVPDTTSKVQNQVAKAVLADTTGRDKALAVLTAVALQVPSQAQAGLATAIEAITTDPKTEVSAEANALTDNSVTSATTKTLAKAVKTDMTGQNVASTELTQLLGSTTMPAEALPGLQSAYDAETAQHGQIADILSRLSSRMPASIRTFVSAIITQARTDATSMQTNRPAPPTGGRPAGTGSGTGSIPTGSGTGSIPTGSGTGSIPTGSGTGSIPTGTGTIPTH